MTQEEFVANQKSRRKRTSISHTNLNVLKKAFILEPFPSRQSVNKLSSEIRLPYRVIKVWFQNERAKKVKKFGRGAFKNNDITGQETSMADIQVITISLVSWMRFQGALRSPGEVPLDFWECTVLKDIVGIQKPELKNIRFWKFPVIKCPVSRSRSPLYRTST